MHYVHFAHRLETKPVVRRELCLVEEPVRARSSRQDPLPEDLGKQCRTVIQIYLDSVTLTTQSPRIETDRSLSAFITKKLRLPEGGRTRNSVKDALARLAASRFLFGSQFKDEKRAATFKSDFIENFDIWYFRLRFTRSQSLACGHSAQVSSNSSPALFAARSWVVSGA